MKSNEQQQKNGADTASRTQEEADFQFLEMPNRRSVTDREFFEEAPQRVIYHFTGLISKTLMKHATQLLFVALMIIVTNIIVAFFIDGWGWKIGYVIIASAIALTILARFISRWATKIVTNIFKKQVVLEGKNLNQFVRSPYYKRSLNSFSHFRSLFTPEALLKAGERIESSQLQAMLQSSLIQNFLHSKEAQRFLENEGDKIIRALELAVGRIPEPAPSQKDSSH